MNTETKAAESGGDQTSDKRRKAFVRPARFHGLSACSIEGRIFPGLIWRRRQLYDFNSEPLFHFTVFNT